MWWMHIGSRVCIMHTVQAARLAVASWPAVHILAPYGWQPIDVRHAEYGLLDS